jgi:hypothetical protein
VAANRCKLNHGSGCGGKGIYSPINDACCGFYKGPVIIKSLKTQVFHRNLKGPNSWPHPCGIGKNTGIGKRTPANALGYNGLISHLNERCMSGSKAPKNGVYRIGTDLR